MKTRSEAKKLRNKVNAATSEDEHSAINREENEPKTI